MTKLALGLAAPLTCVLIVLALRPALDLDVARLFYAGHGHFIGDTRAGLIIRTALWSLPFVLFAAMVLAALAAEAGLVAGAFAPSRRSLVFLTLSLALGPGLVVHTTLKPATHRPRPHSVTQFGGTAAYRPFTRADGDCHDNCSFPSGEAALASWTLAPASLVPPPWRGMALAGAVLLMLATSVARMAYGAHFLSDVTGAMLIMVLVVSGLRALILRSPATGPIEPHESARTL